MQYYEPIHDNFVRFCKARAYGTMPYDDLISESVLKAYQNWEKMERKSALLYYLFTTARHVLANANRKKKEMAMDEYNLNGPTVENNGEANLAIAHLYQQLSRLSDHKREALILFEINGFSIKEIAEIQDAKVGAVKVMLSRARKELRALLEDEPQIVEHQMIDQ